LLKLWAIKEEAALPPTVIAKAVPAAATKTRKTAAKRPASAAKPAAKATRATKAAKKTQTRKKA
jgi:hypothetical protein